MFKWVCLAVAVLFLTVLTWMVNDVRLEVRRSVQTIRTTSETLNEQLPVLVEKGRKTADVIDENLPAIMDKTQTTMETFAELAEDIRQLKELAGLSTVARDKSLVAYADSVLRALEASGAGIGLKKTFGGSGLKNVVPAKEWVVGARKEAVVLTLLARSKKDLATRLSRNKFGSPWYVQTDDKPPVTMLDWLKANHAPSKDL